MQASITALVLLAALAAPGRAATYYMLPDSTGAFTTLQEAVDACVDGDSVVLADGTFYIENPLGVIFWGKNIFFGSASDSPEDCVIDVAAGESGYKFGFNLSQGETRDCVVQGVTVCNGRGHDGGAIHIRGNSNPTVRNCILRDNYSVAGGGGLKAYELSSPLIEGCHVFDNRISEGSGGGGIYCSGDSIDIRGCLVELNDGGNSVYLGIGGGIDADGAGRIRNCIVRYNTVGVVGGGICISGDVSVEGCQIYGNETFVTGGGLGYYTAPSPPPPLVTNTTLVDNASPNGSALWNGNLFVGYPAGPIVLLNCLVTDNHGAGGPFFSEIPSADFTLRCTDVWGNEGGDWVGPLAGQLGQQGNISADPRFCDAASSEYTLRDDSPCLPANNDCGEQMGALGQGCTLTAVPGGTPGFAPLLAQNHPNPFNAHTRIDFSLPSAGSVSLSIYTIAGRERVQLLRGAWLEAGTHRLDWDGTDSEGRALASGVYVYRLVTPWGTLARKLTLLQ